VTLYDVSPEILKACWCIHPGAPRAKNKARNLTHLSQTVTLEDLAGANVVIEAIPEDLNLKQDLFWRLDTICPPPAILATNTSTLRVTAHRRGDDHRGACGHATSSTRRPCCPWSRWCRQRKRILKRCKLCCPAEKAGQDRRSCRGHPVCIVQPRGGAPFYGEALRLLGMVSPY